MTARALPWLALAAALGCDAAPSDGPARSWSALRDALAAGRDPTSIARALEADPRAGAAAEDRAPLDPGASLTARVVAVDRARALAGRDARVAGRYSVVSGEVVASDCGPLFAGPASDGAPELAAWRRRCGVPATVAASPVPGLPTLAAWLPDGPRLLVHPALMAHAAAPAVLAAPLVDGSADCLDDLAAFCARCPTGAEAGCEPLFGPATTPVGCAELDAASPPPPQSGDVPRWRTYYCAWRALETDPRVRFEVLRRPFDDPREAACWDPTVEVKSLDDLDLALPGYSAACQAAIARGWSLAAGGERVDMGRLVNYVDGPIWHDLPGCTALLRDGFCVACADDRAAACVPLFEGSAASTDCYDLGRGEAHGGGFAAWCARDRVSAARAPTCFNAFDPCVNPLGVLPLASFEALVASLPGFFDRHVAERCVAQAEGCLGGDPLPDFDPDAEVPTPGPDPATPRGEADKCPR